MPICVTTLRRLNAEGQALALRGILQMNSPGSMFSNLIQSVPLFCGMIKNKTCPHRVEISTMERLEDPQLQLCCHHLPSNEFRGARCSEDPHSTSHTSQ